MLRTAHLAKLLYHRLPILSFLQNYSVSTALADLIAGISVGLVLIPQGIAYAVVAKLPPAVGLYSSIMGCFLYIIFGTSPELSNAPAAILALMTATYGKGDLSVAIFQSFVGGILIVASGILKLGRIDTYGYYSMHMSFPQGFWLTSSPHQLSQGLHQLPP